MSTGLSPLNAEHGERNPFQFFTDHIDPFIADATRETLKVAAVVGRLHDIHGLEIERGHADLRKVRAIEAHRAEPVLELSPRRFDGAADAIASLAGGGHFGKLCLRAWDDG